MMNGPIINKRAVMNNKNLKYVGKRQRKNYKRGNRRVLKNRIDKVIMCKSVVESKAAFQKPENYSVEQLIRELQQSKLTGMSVFDVHKDKYRTTQKTSHTTGSSVLICLYYSLLPMSFILQVFHKYFTSS